MFRCSRDLDIEVFLREKAVQYEERGWCRVYLLMNKEFLSQKKFKVEAYFTLSHKSAYLQEDISGNTRKKVGRFKEDSNIHFVLIGQLGKHICADEECGKYISKISANDILDRAFEIIGRSHELISCRCVLVECNESEKVHKVYYDYGFKYLQHDGEHHQLFMKI